MACCGRSAINTRSRASARTVPQPVAKSYKDHLLYSTTESSVLGLNGQKYPLGGMLIRSPGRPQGGWRATLPIKGQNVVIQGKTPRETYTAAEKLLTQNGLSVAPRDTLVSLWIQWIQRTPEKYHAVSLKDLLAITTTTPAGEVVADPRKREYKPDLWGHIAWKWLNLFLAREAFNLQEFLAQCRIVLTMLDPNLTPELGCAECWREAAQEIDKLRQNPGMDRTAARLWLFNFHNKVSKRIGRKVFTWEEASRAALWN